MPKRKFIFLGLLVLVLGFGLVLFFFSSPKDRPRVPANISARDTAQLIHATRKELQKEIFHKFSWDSFKHLRERFREYKAWEITEITEPKPGVLRVLTECRLTEDSTIGLC